MVTWYQLLSFGMLGNLEELITGWKASESTRKCIGLLGTVSTIVGVFWLILFE